MCRCLFAAGALLAAFVALVGAARAVEEPYDGNWKVVFLTPQGQEQLLVIMKVEHNAAGPKLEVVALGPNLQGTLEPGKSTKDVLRFTLALPGNPVKFVAYPPKGEKTPKEMYGSLELRGNRFFVRYERTDATEIAQKDAFKMAAGMKDYAKVSRTTDPKEKATALTEFLKDNPSSSLAFPAKLEIAAALAAGGANDAEVQGAAEAAIRHAADYGPEMRTSAVTQVAQKLTASKKAPALAVAYARQAEKALPEDATTNQQVSALKILLSALKQADQAGDVKIVGERLAKLDKILDEEFLKDAVPFTTKAFKREGTAGRVALVELFTGAQCPPCVAADVAFDAAMKTYQPRDVVLLQYHLHIPGPDALTNQDTEKRWAYYKGQGVPSTYVGGGNDLGIGGGKAQGQGSFKRLGDAVQANLEKETSAKITLSAKQTGDDILITAEVAEAGKDTKLRLALVEESVRYPGNNGQRFHHHVVRAMPGGAEGIALKEGKDRQELKVNLTELRRSLAEYLEQANKRRPFLDDERPLDLNHLKVVAFLQNDETKEVLQAVQVDVHR